MNRARGTQQHMRCQSHKPLMNGPVADLRDVALDSLSRALAGVVSRRFRPGMILGNGYPVIKSWLAVAVMDGPGPQTVQ